MMKTLYAIAAVVVLAVGCRPTLPNQPKPSPATIIQPAIELINSCSSDSSLNTMAYRAAFDTATTSLVVYLGQSPAKYSYKWEIPLKEVDKSGFMLFREDYNVSSITLNIIGAQPMVKFYKDGQLKSKSAQFVLYLGKCFSTEDKDAVLQKLYDTIIAVQKP
ncbi:hypothetical protein [uncultured Acetobacteroides sp.]|uniref:hypothetical protein n=1 Tax=uncultured Acetobacteroides sp. TaxID=1760811 RepID=UPI0029F5167D|nr:hypothetical protein [uncultured Acetobacteroides sp.]